MQDYPSYKLPDEHVKSIINIVRTDLEAVDKQNSTYAMLRAVVWWMFRVRWAAFSPTIITS